MIGGLFLLAGSARAPSRSLCEAIFHAFLWSFSAIYHLTNAAWNICSCCKQTGELDQNNTSLNRGTVRGRFRHDAPVNMANTAHKEFMGLFPWTRFLSSHRKPHASAPNDNLGLSRWCVRRTGALTISVSRSVSSISGPWCWPQDEAPEPPAHSAPLPAFYRLKKIESKQVIYLPEDGVYCVSQETFPGFRRQQFGSEDGHELVEVDLAVTWHT